MPRTILIHLNVEADEDDMRSAEQIAQTIFLVGLNMKDDPRLEGLHVEMPLAEEV